MSQTYIAKDAPVTQLGYERVAVSPQGSSPAELLSTAVGISNRKARQLLNGIGSDLAQPLNALRQSDLIELQQAGLTEKQALRTRALIELGRRLYATIPNETLPLESPEAVAAYLNYDLAFQPTERFAVLVMDVKNRPIGKQVLFIGSSTETLASPRQIFQKVLRMGGERLVVAHNHPSGSVQASLEDIALTDQLLQAAQALDLKLVDHLIIGNGEFNSLRQTTALWDSNGN